MLPEPERAVRQRDLKNVRPSLRVHQLANYSGLCGQNVRELGKDRLH